MRVRIDNSQKVISCRGRIVFSRESEDQMLSGKNRAYVNKKYAKNNAIFAGIEKTPILVAFSDNIANQINEFLKNR